jgi:glycosyltransferase involved in cell wall biosynthesis
MLHIYRQVTSLESLRPIVITRKRENADRFPFERVDTVKKPARHFLRRFWFRQVLDAPWQISRGEQRRLQRILAERDAQLLHIYFGHIAVHLLPLIRAWPKPTVVSFHGADALVDMDKPAYREATKEMLGAVKRVLVRSRSLCRAIVELGCDEDKIEIARTGVPLREFPFRERAFPENGEWRFLQAGRLIEKKGVATSLRAFAEFSAVHSRSTITIAGEGPLLEELQALARELKIDNRVSFPGFVSQSRLSELFYASHFFLHPSETGRDGNQEGVPNSMLEAMASGLPVFATNHGGIPEAIENEISGMLVAERDHAALAQALLNAAQDRHLIAQLGRLGSQAVGEKFDQRTQVRKLEDIYLKTIAG